MLQQYAIVFPPCFIDSNDETYLLSVKEKAGKENEYGQEFPARKVGSSVPLEKGHVEYDGSNQIRGWYFNELTKSCNLSLYINGEYVEDIATGLERIDVSEVHGEEALHSGFQLRWDEKIIVNTLEIRNNDTNRAVIGTPFHVQRLEKSVGELERALQAAGNKQSKNIGDDGLCTIFESMRSMPLRTVNRTPGTHLLSRDFEYGVSIIVPVYNGLEELKVCLQSIDAASCDVAYEVVCINDASADEEVFEYLKERQVKVGNLFVINSDVNRGFVKSVNKGLLARRYRDVVLLNSDTIVPDKFVDRLKSAHESDESYGVITPLSNNATIFSFPLTLVDNKLRDEKELSRVDGILRERAANKIYDAPTGHGYCMFVSGEVLEAVGILNEDEWGVGYGEENDFCQKVKMRGWKTGAYYGMYVGHIGSASFGEETKDIQVSNNLQRLNEMYPEYDQLIHNHIKNEHESRVERNLLQIYNWNSLSNSKDILFVTHSLGGGTTEYIQRCTDSLREEDVRSVILTSSGKNLILCDDSNVLKCIYRTDEIDILIEHLNVLKPADLVLNSTFNFPSNLFESLLEVTTHYSVVLHDYSWICPRVNLIDARGSYCGTPSSEVCVKCVEVSGTHESVSEKWKNISTGLDVWLTKNKSILENAKQIIAPSGDTANRIKAKYPTLHPTVKYHSDEFIVPEDLISYKATSVEEQVIGVFGMIGDHKGMKILQKLCWFLSSRHPGVKVVFFGAMSEKEWLDGYPNVKCVGEYDKESLAQMIKKEKPTVSLFLSMWPETYCYALTDSVQHGVFPIAFDIGAFAERMVMHNYGATIPFETDAEKVFQSIVNVVNSDEYKSAEVGQIKNGRNYTNFTVDYLDVAEALRKKTCAVS